MLAGATLRLDCPRGLAERMERHLDSRLPARRAFDEQHFQPALRAVEDDLIPLPGRVRGQRVAHHRAVRVTNGCRHRIVDIDLRIEHAAVAVIAILVFGVEVESAHVVLRAQVEEELAGRRVLASEAAVATLFARRAVELAASMGEDFLRLRVDPPVDKIEVMRGFVDEEPARVLHAPVPAPEKVGAVDIVERPLEIDGEDRADRAILDQPLDLLVLR